MTEQKSAPQAVCVVIRREDERILMVQRADHDSAGGFWTPVSGKPEPGESLPEAAVREVLEETGLNVEIGEQVYACPSVGHRWFLVWFEAKLLSSPTDLSLQKEELSQARWLTAGEAAQLDPMFPDTRDFFMRMAAQEAS